jgi:ATP-dependent Clp protease ATP-binding subunit ClpC
VQDQKSHSKYVEDSLAEEIITSKISIGMKFSWILKRAQELNVKVHKAEEPTKQ